MPTTVFGPGFQGGPTMARDSLSYSPRENRCLSPALQSQKNQSTTPNHKKKAKTRHHKVATKEAGHSGRTRKTKGGSEAHEAGGKRRKSPN